MTTPTPEPKWYDALTGRPPLATPKPLQTKTVGVELAPEAIEAALATLLDKGEIAHPLFVRRLTAALAAAAPIIQAEERARVIQAVHDAAELEPEERDGPHLLVEASLWITVAQLNNLHGIQDGMDWVRYTATDYANNIQQAKAEALREAVSDFESNVGVGEFDEQTRRDGKHHTHAAEAWDHQSAYMDWLRNRADQIEGKSE